jgi:hypothetical protein
MRRLVLSSLIPILLALTCSEVLAGCGGQPCAELAEKVCAVTDQATCKLHADGLGGESPSEAQKKACQIVLDDEQTLAALLQRLGQAAAAVDR